MSIFVVITQVFTCKKKKIQLQWANWNRILLASRAGNFKPRLSLRAGLIHLATQGPLFILLGKTSFLTWLPWWSKMAVSSSCFYMFLVSFKGKRKPYPNISRKKKSLDWAGLDHMLTTESIPSLRWRTCADELTIGSHIWSWWDLIGGGEGWGEEGGTSFSLTHRGI